MSRRRDKKRRAESPHSTTLCRGIAADLSKQVPNNSWGGPVLAYFDVAFKCRDCGKEEVWTAQQQKWYYEVAKGSLYARAVRCRDCRNRITEQKRIQREQMANGDPRPARRNSSQKDG